MFHHITVHSEVIRAGFEQESRRVDEHCPYAERRK